MARDKSPIVKQSRREGFALAPKAHKIMAKKSGIPGQHGDMRVRGGSLYLTQLREKQKVRRLYGLLEKQFAKLMKEAQKAEGLSGQNLLEFLERHRRRHGQHFVCINRTRECLVVLRLL